MAEEMMSKEAELAAAIEVESSPQVGKPVLSEAIFKEIERAMKLRKRADLPPWSIEVPSRLYRKFGRVEVDAAWHYVDKCCETFHKYERNQVKKCRSLAAELSGGTDEDGGEGVKKKG